MFKKSSCVPVADYCWRNSFSHCEWKLKGQRKIKLLRIKVRGLGHLKSAYRLIFLSFLFLASLSSNWMLVKYLAKGNILFTQQSFACILSGSVVSDSLQPHGLQPARFLSPWGFPGKNTGAGCHFLLQGIFLTQGSNPNALHWQAGS